VHADAVDGRHVPRREVGAGTDLDAAELGATEAVGGTTGGRTQQLACGEPPLRIVGVGAAMGDAVGVEVGAGVAVGDAVALGSVAPGSAASEGPATIDDMTAASRAPRTDARNVTERAWRGRGRR